MGEFSRFEREMESRDYFFNSMSAKEKEEYFRKQYEEELQKHESEINSYQKSLHNAKTEEQKNREKELLAITYSIATSNLKNLKNIPKAIEYYNNAISLRKEIFDSIENSEKLLKNINECAECHILLNQTIEAENLYLESINIGMKKCFEDFEVVPIKHEYAKLLSKAYIGLGKLKIKKNIHTGLSLIEDGLCILRLHSIANDYIGILADILYDCHKIYKENNLEEFAKMAMDEKYLIEDFFERRGKSENYYSMSGLINTSKKFIRHSRSVLRFKRWLLTADQERHAFCRLAFYLRHIFDLYIKNDQNQKAHDALTESIHITEKIISDTYSTDMDKITLAFLYDTMADFTLQLKLKHESFLHELSAEEIRKKLMEKKNKIKSEESE